MKQNITDTSPTTGTLIDAMYEQPDYRDAFLVPSRPTAIEEFADSFFLAQPRWLAKVSMNLGDRGSRRDALGDGAYAEGSAVGSWRVCGRSEDEIVFGEYMGFMEYRFSFFRRPDGLLEAGTSVRYLKRFGHIYFAIVRPFHRAFVKVALGNAASPPALAQEPAALRSTSQE